MKFTRLRLVGFKSFVEPTDFMIEPGLTGVVGPNGCGKSNLVEALRWVMGESSYKNMRASGMDDVIFSGSNSRPARNSAEVALLLDNSARTAPAPFNDADMLEVSRRIEREAGSVYRINGREVRARDVQLLFADASTGARSPSMVGQGQVSALISAKPTARRAILEEAAGIAGLHSRRHEAELRLRAAEQNLERLEDVLAEIETQLETLKRQARQAVRYRNISGDIRRAEALLLHVKWVAARETEGETEAALKAAEADMQLRAGAQAETAKTQAIAQAALPGLREGEARAAAALARLTHARGDLEAEEKRVAERIGELTRRLEQIEADMAREKRLLEENASHLRRLADEEASLKEEDGGADARLAEAAATLAAAEAAASEAEAALAEATRAAAEARARRDQLAAADREAQSRLGRIEAEAAKVEAERNDIAAKSGFEAALAERRAGVQEAETRLRQAEAAATAAEAAVEAARTAEAAARAPLAEAQNELGRLEAEAATLARVLDVGAGADSRPILDAISVTPGYEAALGAALGEDLDVPADESAPVRWTAPGAGEGDPVLPEGVEPLAGQVKAPALLARRLAQIGVVDPADGARLARLLKPGQRLVSRNGDLWRWDGYAANAEAPTAAARRLEQKNRLAELERSVATARQVLATRRVAADEAAAAARAAQERERAAREEWRLAQRAVSEARDRLEAVEREAARVATRLGALAEAAARLETSLEEARTARADAAAALAGAPHVEAIEARVETLRTTAAERRSAVLAARSALDGLQREREQRARRLEAIAGERIAWQERARNAEAHLATLAARAQESETERASLTEVPAALAEKRRGLAREIEAAEVARKEAADRLAEAEAALAAADRAAREALDAFSLARETRGRAEERFKAAGERRVEIEKQILDTLDCAPHEAATIAELKPGAALPEIAAVEARLERLAAERERLGAVNLRAEEEAREIEERREALVRDRDDLVEAIRRLRQGIQSLNREGRERLLSAFETVNRHFQDLFTTLFGGGTAELQLVDSDDPLEAGLEILARPPGKKPQTMTLLSGGEQALTALALIFAVFLTNPAPICVLDEVDAPLDDMNVERFCDLVERIVGQTETRFVVITHNPITMSRMHRLFGVTMAERGVSQLVSVDLETAERFREAG